MTRDQVKAVLERVPTWPEDRQQELAEVALEIEAELASTGYDATPDELAAIDEGLAGEPKRRSESLRAIPEGRRVQYSKRALTDLLRLAAVPILPSEAHYGTLSLPLHFSSTC